MDGYLLHLMCINNNLNVQQLDLTLRVIHRANFHSAHELPIDPFCVKSPNRNWMQENVMREVRKDVSKCIVCVRKETMHHSQLVEVTATATYADVSAKFYRDDCTPMHSRRCLIFVFESWRGTWTSVLTSTRLIWGDWGSFRWIRVGYYKYVIVFVLVMLKVLHTSNLMQ